MDANLGRCSQICKPGVWVGMGRNSPRISAGASGLGAKLSCCASPPDRKIKMQDLALTPNGALLLDEVGLGDGS